MELVNKKPLIIVLSGKSGSGKSKVAEIFNMIYKEKNIKSISIAYAYYLKEYAKNIIGWDLNEQNKPRTFLQELGVDLIKNKIDDNMLINRIIEDVKVYSYFYDSIIISDARFKNEIDDIKNTFSRVISIHITGGNNRLSEKEKNHITETSLDDYNNYDYVINNNGNIEELYDKISIIVEALWER